MIFEATVPGFSILLKTPFDAKDAGPGGLHPEWTGMDPRGFPITFKRSRMDNGNDAWIYDTDKDRRLFDNYDLKKECEKKLVEDAARDPNFRIYEPPKEQLYKVEDIRKLQERVKTLEGLLKTKRSKDQRKEDVL